MLQKKSILEFDYNHIDAKCANKNDYNKTYYIINAKAKFSLP